MIKWLAFGLAVAATASGANSCDTNPNNVHRFGDTSSGIYTCHFDIRSPENEAGRVVFYVRNYCDDAADTPLKQFVNYWVEIRSGPFQGWRQHGGVRTEFRTPSYPDGTTTRVAGGKCQPDTEVRLSWRVYNGIRANGTPFGPISDAEAFGIPAPC